MHWLALYCPTLPLDCILRRWPDGLDPALAVTELDGSRRLVMVATRRAQTGGVFAGQSVVTALALSPDLVLVSRKPEDERHALTEAALAVLRFTPTVVLRASGLLMEISASLKLFGGRRVLKREVEATMKTQGLRVATAEAPTPHGAWLMAQENARRRDEVLRKAGIDAATDATSPGRHISEASFRVSPSRVRSSRPSSATSPTPSPSQPTPARPVGFQAALDTVPIAHLDHGRHQLRRMDGIGCYTIADLRRLPTKGLARRFGTALTDELARATGDKPDPQVVFQAPTRFDARVELMARVETAEALVFACQRLLVQLTGWLSARRAAVRGFTLMLHHERWTRDAIEPTAVAIALATPTRELDRLSTLVRERLSRLELKAPVLELVLEAPAIVEEEEIDGRLFPERDQPTDSLARLLEKLTARLGPEATTRVERVADHRPERAWRKVAAELFDRGIHQAIPRPRKLPGSSKVPSTTMATPPEVSTFLTPITPGCTCGPRPAWLLTEPRQLEVRSHRPYLESQPLQLVAGPERIESGWWDDAAATRDYFIAENAAGHLVWIYRERLLAFDRPQWYLQGLFA